MTAYFVVITTTRHDLDPRDVALMVDMIPGAGFEATVYSKLADLVDDQASPEGPGIDDMARGPL